MLAPWYQATVIDIEPISPNTRIFRVELPDIANFSFRAGQFMTFDLPIHEKRNRRWRSYSIASAPDSGNILEFVIVYLEGGAGTQYLFNEVNKGTIIAMRGAQGVFTLPEVLPLDKQICFVCTGTGIAPFRAMLLEIAQKKIAHPPIQLIFGTRYESGILYRQEMEGLTSKINLQYHIALSREASPANFGAHSGYVHAIYEQLYAHCPPAQFYLCGWNEMLDEAKIRLQNLGYSKQDICFESYS